MPETTRTFVAIPIGEAVTNKLARLRERLEPLAPGARWVRGENVHVTLAFLGDVDVAMIVPVCEAVRAVAARFSPTEMLVKGLGAFPNGRRPSVLWAGLTGESLESLVALRKEVQATLRATGYPVDDRFSPHITLARFKPTKQFPAPDLTRVLDEFKTWSAGRLAIEELVVFSSTVSREGPTYAPLSRTRFGSSC